ncbi:MAG: MFS transporter, partial [Hyphomicrobiaceae bacterium]
MTLCSGFGQTYFVSVFGTAIRTNLNLSHTVYGACYSVGTLSSAVLLIWAGRIIDRTSLIKFSMAAICGLAFAVALLSEASSWLSLAFAFFATRFFGQGLMVHASMTTMAREFSAKRGRAVSLASTGHVAGSATLPGIAIALMAFMSWQNVWLIASAFLLLVTLPAVLFLVSYANRNKEDVGPQAAVTQADAHATPSASAEAAKAEAADPANWPFAEIVRNPGLYIRLAVLLAPAFIAAGYMFHQAYIVSQKGWDLKVIAAALAAYSIGSFVMTLATGPLVDRFTSNKLIPVTQVPLILSCLMMTHLQSETGALTSFALLGLSMGMTQVVFGAIWAELYGTAHLGAVRAFTGSSVVVASGLAPGTLGHLMDHGWSVASISLALAIYCFLAAAISLVVPIPKRRQPQTSNC